MGVKQNYIPHKVLKINSSKILKSKGKNYIATLTEMKKNDMIVSLADSQTFRFIDDINGVDREHNLARFKSIRKEIKSVEGEYRKGLISKSDASAKIIELRNKIDDIQICNDYIEIVMDNKCDIEKLNDGFYINGESYKRYVGTTGGVKVGVVVYVSERIFDEISNRLDNGRDHSKKIVAAKLEAYRALSCSASVPVSLPNGILVVDDLVLNINTDIMIIDGTCVDETTHTEPLITKGTQQVEIDNSDGYGLVSPALAERWSADLGLNYLMSGVCIRNSYCKGMVFTFDFHEFAKRFANSGYVTDAWGNIHNIENIEMILTTSMLKLWDSYKSIDHYIECCNSNGYTFAVTKASSHKLDEERCMNYQFIQSYDLSDDDIDELISPTVEDYKSIIGGNIDTTLLFLRGRGVDEHNALNCDNDFIKALSIDERMYNDPFVINNINRMMKRRINDAKIGVIKTKGNYAILSGDPFALCQHIFKTNVDENGNDIENEMGLLKAGEIYHKHWIDRGVNRVTGYRAPMSCFENIISPVIVNSDDCNFWYQYMNTIAILNCHDACALSLNGADMDSDLLYTTDNKVLLKNWHKTPAITCVAESSNRICPTDWDLLQSNKNGFGNSVGSITNRITAMYDIRALYDKGSKEYEELTYRTQCGVLFQQSEIDKIKTGKSTPMPTYWYKRQPESVCDKEGNVVRTQEEVDRNIYENRLCSSQKPYFMIYIYDALMKEYKDFVKTSNDNCLIDYGCSVSDLVLKDDKSDEEIEFLNWYHKKLPVTDYGSTMNRLCHAVEREFSGYTNMIKGVKAFDKEILKSDVEYDKHTFNAVKKIYEEYRKADNDLRKMLSCGKISSEDRVLKLNQLSEVLKNKCIEICPDSKVLCNVLVDILYKGDANKAFCWNIVGDTIIDNLLEKNGNRIAYITKDKNGEIISNGERFTKRYMEVVE